MLKEEFEQRTGFYPDQALYSIIEKHYMEFNGDKDAFCKAYITHSVPMPASRSKGDGLRWKRLPWLRRMRYSGPITRTKHQAC